jgi:hypothetical protein
VVAPGPAPTGAAGAPTAEPGEDSARTAVLGGTPELPPAARNALPGPGVVLTPVPDHVGALPIEPDGNTEAPPEARDVLPLSPSEQFALDFPWGKGTDGDWQGTGSPDPEPIRNVPDAEMVKRALDTDPDHRGDRYTAMVSVARRHLPQAISVIQTALSDSYEFTRQIAVSALIEHGGPSALSLLWRALQDPAPKIRGSAIWGIALYGQQEGYKAVTAGLSDSDPGVQGMAILATTSLRDFDKIWPILENAARSDEQRVYQEAAYVLSNIESRRAMEVLAKGLRDAKDHTKQETFSTYLRLLRNRAPQLLLPQSQR